MSTPYIYAYAASVLVSPRHDETLAPGQFYNPTNGPGEATNIYSNHPEIVAESRALLDATLGSGRGAPKRSARSICTIRHHVCAI